MRIPQLLNSSPAFSNNEDEQDAEESDGDDEDDENDTEDSDGDTTEDAVVSDGSEKASMVLLDEAGIKITAPSLELQDEMWGPELKVLVENNTDQNITLQVKYAAVNDIMVTAMLYTDIQAGKKANESI
jgi:hypothetical protein